MVNAISSSLVNSMVGKGTKTLVNEANRRAIAKVFENATYNKQGFAQATHDALRMVDRFGKTQKIMFFPKLSSQTILEKSLNLLKRVITKH
jgi:hypothetical protein